jgi:hypothetical protein
MYRYPRVVTGTGTHFPIMWLERWR